ncbi:MAG: uroporphyrinogen-III synthase [Sulfurovum sp.]
MIYLLSPLKKDGTIHLPMIKFSLTTETLSLSGCDILMFTSKQAVKSANELNPLWKDIPCLAIGKATAKMIESLGGEVIHQPKEFYGKSLSADIIDKFGDKKILYIRPKEVSFDSKTFLSNHNIDIKEQIIYKTSCISYTLEDTPPPNSIIIFTSPSTIKCFLTNFNWDSSYTAVVIGKATKIHLPFNAKVAVADTPLLDSCIEKAIEIKLSIFGESI